MRSLRSGAVASLVLVLILSWGCTALGSDEGALLRGDEAFARGDVQEALAEYRLAVRQGAEDAPTLLRAAHAYALVGRLDEARDHYRQALALDPGLVDQAVSSLVHSARDANGRGDQIGAASALEFVLEIRPGVSVGDLALPLARHFGRTGQYAEALPYYHKALADAGAETDPELVFELAMAYEELGDCERAILYFEEVRDEVVVSRRDRVDWHVGSCSYRLGREARQNDEVDDAIRYLDTLISLGEPRNLLAQAHFEQGEVYAKVGECDRAVQAFEAVQRSELTAPPFLVQRAQERVDEIRFGQGCSTGSSSRSSWP